VQRACAVALLVVLAISLSAEVVLPLRSHANHCSCAIKGPCCEGAVCPMEKARRDSKQCSLRTCDPGEVAIAATRPVAVMFDATTLATTIAQSRTFISFVAMTLHGVARVPEQPPRG